MNDLVDRISKLDSDIGFALDYPEDYDMTEDQAETLKVLAVSLGIALDSLRGNK